MHLGRLLESGKPADLYARPATRFVATFLGAANLLLARQTAQGVRLGAAAVGADADLSLNARDHEVVAVLRPEEVELAASREQLSASYIADGRVEEVVFIGGTERLRVRLAENSNAPRLTDATVIPLPAEADARSSCTSPTLSMRNFTVMVASPVISSEASPSTSQKM